MRIFRKFYEGLSDSVVPVLVICGVVIIGWLAKVFSGSGITDSDMSMAMVAAVIGVATIVLWIICTIIRTHQRGGRT